MLDEPKTIAFKNAQAFDDWLVNNHTLKAGIWVKVAKKNSGVQTITENELVEVGLCWGWISGQRKSLDDQYYLQKYVPRRPRSLWSQVNVDKVAVLTKAGQMRQPGVTEVKAAQADGRWQSAYASQSNATPPPDLLSALGKDAAAKAHFDNLNKTEQYAVIFQLMTARNGKNRTERLNKLITSMSDKHKPVQ